MSWSFWVFSMFCYNFLHSHPSFFKSSSSRRVFVIIWSPMLVLSAMCFYNVFILCVYCSISRRLLSNFRYAFWTWASRTSLSWVESRSDFFKFLNILLLHSISILFWSLLPSLSLLLNRLDPSLYWLSFVMSSIVLFSFWIWV